MSHKVSKSVPGRRHNMFKGAEVGKSMVPWGTAFLWNIKFVQESEKK